MNHISVVNILGMQYSITIKKYSEDEAFERYKANGYCSGVEKAIVLCDMTTYPDWENETDMACDSQMKETLRHEIVHAFLNESGLAANRNESNAWARNEEMVDWIALQGPKLYKAWQEVGAL